MQSKDKEISARDLMFDCIKLQFPLPYLLYKAADKLLPFLDKQGEIKKADEKFFTNIIRTAKENDVKEFTLKLSKSQMTGLDITFKKVKQATGFDFDIGIKGETEIELSVKFKE
jgi:hypothetical protein